MSDIATCPRCGRVVRVAGVYGQRVTCAWCGYTYIAPGATVEPPSLFDPPVEPSEWPPGMSEESIQGHFLLFHAANPWVYDELVRLTRGLRARGRLRVGIGMLFEVLRWSYYMRTDDPNSEFKLNNNYRSRYARLIMQDESDLDGVFETRELRS